MMRPAVAWGVAGICLSGAALAASTFGTALTTVDREVPVFSLEAMQGPEWTPADFDGQPVIVNFWATWCAPCVEEIPAMNTAWKAVEGEGIRMVAINAGEGREAIDAFVAKVPIDFPILLGDGATTLPEWQVRALPTTLVIDSKGRVVFEALGPRDWASDELLDQVRALRVE